jgi:SAM-dependent methyltransferase
VYQRCGGIDHCNFSNQTIWSDPTDNQKFGSHVGRRFVAEACDLSTIPDGAYDFVAASHVLEHIANPLRALQQWQRVLKREGILLVIVPHKCGTFDRRRAFTSFEHIEADLRANTPEDDLTHLDEILELHDLDLDPPAGSPLQFRDRCLRNSSVRGMHHHVFSPEVLVLMFNHLRMRVLHIVIERPFHIIGLAQVIDASERQQAGLHNLGCLGESAEWRKRDPFRGVTGI